MGTPSGSARKLATVRRLPPSDADIARAAASHEVAAQGQAWDRFSPLVRGMLRRSLGPLDDVEDQVQEVFIRFFRNLPTLRDPEAVRPFLIGISMRVAATELRRRRMRRWLFLSPSGVVPEETSSQLDEEARDALRRLYAILDRLSDSSRLAYTLRFIEGLELTDVAAALDISLATAKRRLSKVQRQVIAIVERDPVLADYLSSEGASHEHDAQE
jgi:RNA polymerase sigma-70 factor (ECF subfamily)